MGADLVLSTSSMSQYLRCHYQWFLSHVYRAAGRQSIPAAIGQAVHSGVEAYWKSPIRPQAALERAWAREVRSVPTSELDADPRALPDARAMLGVYIAKMAPDRHPIMIEAPFSLRTEGVILTGTLDYADDGVRDLKTTAGKTINGVKPSSFNPRNHRLQLTLYSWGYKALQGRWPKRLLLDLLTRKGAYRKYELEPDHGAARDVLGIVRDGITREDFEPTGALTGACRYCPYTQRCPYVVLD